MQRTAEANGQTRGWVVGRVAGAPVVVSRSWLLAAVVLTFMIEPVMRRYVPDAGVQTYVLALLDVLLLFGSVFLHEVAHALVARRRGMEVHELAVTLLGGHTRMGGSGATPATSALVAVAGPTVNVVLAVLTWLLWQQLPAGGIAAALVGSLALANGFVGVLNLVPGLPLDGGYVLEALVWRRTGRRSRGTVVAGWSGRVVAVAFVAWLVLLPAVRGARPDLPAVVWAVVIGGFLWSGATQAIRGAALGRTVDALRLTSLMRPAIALLPSDTLADLDSFDDPTLEVVLLDVEGEPAGYVDLGAAASVPGEHRDRTPLAAVSVPLPPEARVRGSLAGGDAVRAVALASARTPVMTVLADDGQVVGLLRAQDVIDALRTG